MNEWMNSKNPTELLSMENMHACPKHKTNHYQSGALLRVTREKLKSITASVESLVFRFRESQRPHPGDPVLRLQRPGPLLLEAGPGQRRERHRKEEPDHRLLVRDLAAGQHSPAQVRSGSRYCRVTSGYSGPMRPSSPRARWERNMENVWTSGRHWPSSCFLKGVISYQEFCNIGLTGWSPTQIRAMRTRSPR